MLQTTTPTALLGLIFGGVLSLLYGVRLITEALQNDAGLRLRRYVQFLSTYPLAAFGVGMGMTMVTQSSGAISSLLVSLVSVGVLPLTIAIITLLGTDIGSAIMVQFLLFPISDLAYVMMGVGALVAMVTRHGPRKGIGQACFGFSLVIFGLAALEAGSRPLAGNHLILLIFESLVASPLVLVLIGMGLTMAFSSSIAGIGLVIVLASNGSLPLAAAVALMLGSNVGSTVTAMLTALSRGSVAGRRLALVHTGTNLVVACVGLLMLGPVTALLSHIPLPPATLVALSHLGFNLILVLLFIPLCRPLAFLVEKLLPEADTTASTSMPRILITADACVIPAVALGQAMREVGHMTDLFTEMLAQSIHAFEGKSTDVPEAIKGLDDQLDELNEALKYYLVQLDEAQMTPQQKQRQVALLYVIADLEAMGDLLDKQWMRLARRKRRKQIAFFEQDWQEIVDYHRDLTAVVQLAFAALAAQDAQAAANFFTQKTILSQKKRVLQMQHMRRIQAGVASSVESSALHLDVLSSMRTLLSHASAIAHVVQENLSVHEQENEELWQDATVVPSHVDG